jgi:hypothetical protein
MPGRTFELKRDQGRGEWKRRLSKELNYLYSSPNTFRMIKLGRME